MTPSSALFVAQLALRTLLVAHGCLKTYRRVKVAYLWLSPPAACLWSSFIQIETVPDVDEFVLVSDEMTGSGTDGSEEAPRGRSAPRDTREEEGGEAGWVTL